MTRGKIVIITDKTNNNGYCLSDLGFYVSNEFNGDMYISCYGKEVIKALKDIDSVKKYHDFLKGFNDNNFQYDIDYFRTQYIDISKNKELDFATDYFDFWFSDYIYVKNISNEVVMVKCKDEENNVIETTINTNEIKVFNFGSEYNYEKEIIELEEEEIFSQLKELGTDRIDLLYKISCLKCSGLDTDNQTILKMANILNELWLKDENNSCISWLSDKLVYLYNHNKIDLENYSKRDLLFDIYTLNDDEGIE